MYFDWDFESTRADRGEVLPLKSRFGLPSYTTLELVIRRKRDGNCNRVYAGINGCGKVQ